MPTLFTRKIISLGLVLSFGVQAATVSRVTSFSDGEVLFAADLESEFNNLVDNINSLDNDNLASGANISPSKISATIAGDGIARNGATGILEVNDDNSTLEISGDVLQVKDDGITVSKIAEQAALSVLGNGTNATANVTALTAATDGHVLRRSGTAVAFGTVATDGIADGAVTQAKRAALGQQISSSGSGVFTTTSTSAVDVTNLSVTITTTGRPVYIGLIHDSSISSLSYIGCSDLDNGCQSEVKILRDATLISNSFLWSQSVGSSTSFHMVPTSSVNHIDTPAAGTYTYKIQTLAGSGDTAHVIYAKLVAYEL
jgi:hypothetical protein